MRFTILLALVVLAISAVDSKIQKDKKQHKKNDFDELDDLLFKVNEVNKKTFTEDDDDDDDDDDNTFKEDSDKVESTKAPVKNPCEDHICGWGKECSVDKRGKPKCGCATKCPDNPEPDNFDKVCSNQNETFDSICHLYRERCLCKKGKSGCVNDKHQKAHLEYLGVCKGLDECTADTLAQFAERMSDWLFQVMRDLKKRRELHGEEWMSMLDEAESDDHLKHVYPVIWKFCDLDRKPHDKSVTHHELIPITAPVIPMESCIKPFLRSCDVDGDDKITLKEWGKCLGLKEKEIVERC